MNVFLIIRVDLFEIRSVYAGGALVNSNDERYYDYRRAYLDRRLHSALCDHVYSRPGSIDDSTGNRFPNDELHQVYACSQTVGWARDTSAEDRLPRPRRLLLALYHTPLHPVLDPSEKGWELFKR